MHGLHVMLSSLQDDCCTEHLNEVSMKACEFQSDNYKLHCGIHVLSQELRVVRFQMAKCKGMNERLGKKNEERKKDKQSLGLFLMRHMNRDFSVPQKLLDFEAGMKQCKEQPILDKLSRAGVTRRRRMM